MIRRPGLPLAVPMVYLYDLVLVVPAAAWLWSDMRLRGAARWQRSAGCRWRGVQVASMGAMLGVFLIATQLEIQTGALLVGVLLALERASITVE